MLLPLLLLVGLLTTLDGSDDDGGAGEEPGDNDTLAGSGTDRIFGGEGDDLLMLKDEATGLGGVGNDTITAEDDAMGYGLEGDDRLVGGDNVTLKGGEGNDTVDLGGEAHGEGGAGDDLLLLNTDAHGQGDAGNDTLHAQEDAQAYGGEGDDEIALLGRATGYGGAGDDWMSVAGRSEVTGGTGGDMFVADLSDYDMMVTEMPLRLDITDFAAGSDRLAFVLGDRPVDQIEIHKYYSAEEGGMILQLAESVPDGEGRAAEIVLRGVTEYDLNDLTLYGTGPTDPLALDTIRLVQSDVITAGGTDTAYGGAGADQMTATDDAVADAGEGDDKLTASDTATVFGRTGADRLVLTGQSVGDGGLDPDVVQAYDTSTGYGSYGFDRVMAHDSATGYGGSAADRLEAFDRATVHGDDGDDIILTFGDASGYGGAGNDTLFLDEGNGPSDGVLDGGDGNDRVGTVGQMQTPISGSATIAGGAGDDIVSGEASHFLFGGDGNDVLWRQVYEAGTSEAVSGGAGNDLFHIWGRADTLGGDGEALIADFTPGKDTLLLSLPPGDWLSNLEVTSEVVDGSTRITVDFDQTAAPFPDAGPVGGTPGSFLYTPGDFQVVLQGVTDFDMADLVLTTGPTGFPLTGDAAQDSAMQVVNGTSAADILAPPDGAVVFGGGGDDLIRAGGLGYVSGGAGDDVILRDLSDLPNANVYAAHSYGGEGSDRIVIGENVDSGFHFLPGFDPAVDQVGLIVPPADAGDLRASYSTFYPGDTEYMVNVFDGDVRLTLRFPGLDQPLPEGSIRLYADEAAALAGTPYRTI